MKFQWKDGKLVEGQRVPWTFQKVCEDYTLETISLLLITWYIGIHFGLSPLLHAVKLWLAF